MDHKTLRESLKKFCADADARINAIARLEDLEKERPLLIGKNSMFYELAQNLKTLPPEEKREIGQFFNQEKSSIEDVFKKRREELIALESAARLQRQHINLGLPSGTTPIGSAHPTTATIERIITIFQHMGFALTEGPEIEDPEINFSALNMPEFHPARSMQDTFYLNNHFLLRTHTSNMQVRMMRKQKAPLRILSPGRVFRSDSDNTHSPMFHQIEGLFVDTNVSFSQLLWTLQTFLSHFFNGKTLQFRTRPSYFPFTQPSVEIDIAFEDGNFIEVLGCGMVHPSVLDKAGIDSTQNQGFAFGLGVERFAMLANNIQDLRPFFESKQTWLTAQRKMDPTSF